ncbi:MAG: hypothetical protein WCC12_09920, partial [Anaerolineales bacterium]
SILSAVLMLLDRLPWRSEAITTCLARFEGNKGAAKGLREFIVRHEVYIWHRTNALWALYKVSGAKSVEDICRTWVANANLDWYARTVAARILADVPAQHAFLLECLKREQSSITSSHLDTEILRQELAYGAFKRIRSESKQLSLLKLICNDPSPLMKRLAIYILQQLSCKVVWNDLRDCHENMKDFSDLIVAVGVSPEAPRPCLIADTMIKMYGVSLNLKDLRGLYLQHYEPAISPLRNSISAYHKNPDEYISEFHKFVHLTIIGFYESVLPTEAGLYSNEGYGGLVNRSIFSQTLPNGLSTWKDLGGLRNRVDHPVDTKTRTHSRKIEYKEMHNIFQRLKVALAELFEVWENHSTVL